jgi:hypothetical protein
MERPTGRSRRVHPLVVASLVAAAGWAIGGVRPALAQIPSAEVGGTITDSTKAVVAQARVTLRRGETGVTRSTLTSDSGRYRLTSVEPGDYDIEVSSPGFMRVRQRLALRVGDQPTIDFELSPGFATDLEIEGRASGIDTTGFKVDGAVSRPQIENLPLNGRSFLELARLEPGVQVDAVVNAGAFGNNYQRVSIGGASYLQTRITVDGSAVEDRINGGTAQNFSQESVQEFQISTFSFDPATATTGTGAVNIVTRRGGNDYHGSLFFYYRDHSLAAYPGLRRDPANPDPFFARKQFGLSLGGPLKKDRVFWFVNAERLDQDGVSAVANNHPIFSKLDVVSPNHLDFALVNARVDGRIGERHNGFVRYSLDDNAALAPPSTGIFMPSNWQSSDTRAFQVQGGLTSVLGGHAVNEARLSYAELRNQLSAVTPDQCGGGQACSGAGAPEEILVFDAPLFRIGSYFNAPKLILPRTLQLVDTLTWQKGTHRLRLGVDWEHSHLQSIHSLYQSPQITLWGPTNLLASPATRPLYDALPITLRDPSAGPPTFEDILQLPVRSVTLGVGDPSQPGPYHNREVTRIDVVRLSAQDSWTVRPRLTLSYGLAYLYRSDIYNQDLTRPAYLAPVLGGNLEPPHGGTSSVDPSLGVAWALGASGKTVIHGGGGLYHEPVDFFFPYLERGPLGPSGNGRIALDGSLFGINFRSTPTSFRGTDLVTLVPSLRAGVEAKLGDGSDPAVRGVEVVKQGDRMYSPDQTTPYAVHLTAGIRREVTRDLVLGVDLVLRRTLHLGGLTGNFPVDRNRSNRPRVTGVDPATGAVSFVRDPVIPACTPAQTIALDPRDQCSTGPLSFWYSGGTAVYKGLHVTLEKRMSSGLQLTASYALASGNGLSEIIAYDDPAAGYGNLAGVRRHRSTMSAIYRVPKYSGPSTVLRGLLNTWTAAFISEIDSAPPLNTLLVGLDLDGDGIDRSLLPGTTFNSLGRGLTVSQLRDLVAGYNADIEARTRRVTNPDGRVTSVRPRTPANQVLTPIVLPDRLASGDTFITQDLRLTRDIDVGERLRLRLIGEVFNLFNVSNLTGYGGTLNQAGYGQPSARAGQAFGTGGPRAFQLAARLEF